MSGVIWMTWPNAGDLIFMGELLKLCQRFLKANLATLHVVFQAAMPPDDFANIIVIQGEPFAANALMLESFMKGRLQLSSTRNTTNELSIVNSQPFLASYSRLSFVGIL